jgi:hypothetical protein
LQGNKNEKEAKKKKVDVHLLTTYALVIFWSNIFCNTTSTTSSATPLQQRLLQHRFNTTFATSSSVAPLQHCFCNIVFYSIASTSLL